MKTLDEVIKAYEICTNPDTCDDDDACRGCPYANEAYEPKCYGQDSIDALYYLKRFRTLEFAYIKAMADLEDNPPLSFDETRDMLGKPVWVEWSTWKGWRLVNLFDSVTTGEKAVALTDRYGVDAVFSNESFDRHDVMVYRKERG